MKTTVAHVGERRRRRYFFPSCYSAPPVLDSDDFDPSTETSPAGFYTTTSPWSRFRRRSRTVPVEDISGDSRSMVASPEIATEGIEVRKGLLQKICKERNRVAAKPPVEKSTAKLRQCNVSHQSTKAFYRRQPPAPLNRMRDPVQTGIRTSHPGSPNPNPLAPPASPAPRQLDLVPILVVVMMTLTALLCFGRLLAVFCTCFCLFLLALLVPSPAPLLLPEIGRVEAVDVYSPAYKKKVVLSGLLDRSMYR